MIAIPIDGSPIERLKTLMTILRDRHEGCPWDVEQTFETLSSYTIEEAYEVDHAIKQADYEALKEELGDLLLQIILVLTILIKALLMLFCYFYHFQN